MHRQRSVVLARTTLTAMAQRLEVLLILLSIFLSADASIWTVAIVRICGTANLTLSADNPCLYHLSSLSVAWNDCQASAESSLVKKDFKSCFKSCVSDTQCHPMCTKAGFKKAECDRQCKVALSCLKKAASHGDAKNEAAAVNCLEPFVPPDANFSDGSLITAAFRRKLNLPTSFLQDPDSGDLKAKTDTTLESLDPACDCSASGVVDGLNTGMKGCGHHGKEPKASGQYCYVVGGRNCVRATASSTFKGTFFTSCFDHGHHYRLMFPESCYLNMARHDAVDVINITAPLSSGEEIAKNLSKVIHHAKSHKSRAESKAEALLQGMKSWKNPLPSDFFAKHKGLKDPAALAKEVEGKMPPVLRGAKASKETTRKPSAGFWYSRHPGHTLRTDEVIPSTAELSSF